MVAHARETDAIVLNCTEHGESDVIVTLCVSQLLQELG